MPRSTPTTSARERDGARPNATTPASGQAGKTSGKTRTASRPNATPQRARGGATALGALPKPPTLDAALAALTGADPETVIGALTRRAPGQHLSEGERRVLQGYFLQTFRDTGNLRVACDRIRTHRATVYRWLENDPEFAAQFQTAREEAADVLVAAAFNRAVTGWDTPMVSGGRVMYEEVPVLDAFGNPVLDRDGRPMYSRGRMLYEHRWSDTLLSSLLKTYVPAFREAAREGARVEVTGKGGGPIEVSELQDAKTRLRAKLHDLAARAREAAQAAHASAVPLPGGGTALAPYASPQETSAGSAAGWAADAARMAAAELARRRRVVASNPAEDDDDPYLAEDAEPWADDDEW